ncbi:DUF4365 domain-containing protein [bacterium]|nr:DUF4365 domain-containing protein [bacterium]
MQILRSTLPPHWILRILQPDYGIDCEIEIVEDTSVTGALIKAQIKGTAGKSARERQVVHVKSASVRYWLLSPVPVILVEVDEAKQVVRWLDVREYLLAKGFLDGDRMMRAARIPFDFKHSFLLPDNVSELREIALEHQAGVMRKWEEDQAWLTRSYIAFHYLIILYNGDIDSYIEYMRKNGSMEQMQEDLPLLFSIREQLADDPELIHRIRRLVEEGLSDDQEWDM